jgi:Rne/Rng family ribonuclease
MSKEICISSTPHETRLAILENEQLTEVYYERENEYTLAGSIYKGRVTRVLPGMQSAFVDLGLERDAFLYVTDFMEEQEDSSDFERIPASGRPEEGGQEPRHQEPRQQESRNPEPRNQEPRQNQNSQRREQRPPRAPQVAAAVEGNGAPRGNGAGNPGTEGQAPAGEFEDGTRRWRGRRGRRRGFRQGQGGQPGGQQTAQEQAPRARTEVAQSIEPAAPVEADAGDRRSPVTFSLPGESLSKYGGQSAEKAPAVTPAPQVESGGSQTRSTVGISKPSTLIEIPLHWDGAGPLPGESISRYRGAPEETASAAVHPAEPVVEEEAYGQEESYGIAPSVWEDAAAHENLTPHAGLVEPEQVTAFSAVAPAELSPAHEAVAPAAEAIAEVVEEVHTSPTDEPAAAPVEFEPHEASASYRIDASAPSEFRFASPSATLAEEEVAPEEEAFEEPLDLRPEASGHEPSAFSAAGSTGVAELDADFDELEDEDLDAAGPETGLVEEEEVTEEEEYDFTPLFVESEEHDLQELEEETLDHEVAAGGEIGEMVRDAHLDQRIDGDASGLTIEDEAEEDEFEEEHAQGVEESEPEEGQVAAAPGQPARRQRDDQRRGGRGGRNDGRRRQNGRRQNAQTSDLPIISELLKQGQEILVQIAKEPIAKKGARITSHIALPGRFLVFMPTVNHVGVSRKISSDEERQRLKRILISEKGSVSGGFIVRTAADGASEDDLRADIRFLISLWTEIKQRSDTAKAPALIYHDLNLVERILRDQVSDNFSTIWVDTEAEYERIVRFLERFQPSLVRRVKLYTKETPLFEQFGIQDEITKALKSKVWLKSGGSIVINQTEALVAIDINTGKYVGKTARLEDTILKTNLDAIPEIVRQIRLRDLGGIIVIDFIDMDERKNRNKVMQALEEELKSDRAPSKVLQFNDFGLVAITRKRVKQSLERTLSIQCGICAGTGMVKSPTTVCNEIYIEMRKMQLHLERQDVLLRVHPEVVKTLKLGNARWLNELEEMSGKTIIVKSDPTLHPEQFDIH